MKAIIIYLFFSMAISVFCHAQITIGPRIGFNISDIKEFGVPFASDNNLFNPKISYHAGAFVKLPTSKKVFILGEIVYSRKGSRLQDQLGNRFNFRLNYLSMPTLVGIQINEWSVIFGPEFGLNVSEKNPNSDLDISLVGGFKYYSSKKMQLGLRFIQGLTALNNLGLSDGGGITGFNKLRNQTWQISLSHDLFEF